MIELRITVQQAAAVRTVLEKAFALADQSPNIAVFLGIDSDTREQGVSVKNKIKIS